MDNSAERIVSLRRYIALLRQEETRLDRLRASTRSTAADRANADAAFEANTKKLLNADKELRDLEGRTSRSNRFV
jgi:hypothetical protein